MTVNKQHLIPCSRQSIAFLPLQRLKETDGNNELLVQQIDGTCLNRSTGTSAPPLKEECACVNGGGSQSARMCVYKCVCRGERETERDRETGTHPLVSQPAVV